MNRIKKPRNKHFCFSVCAVLHRHLWLCVSSSLCSSLHPRQPLWLRSCCHLLSVLLTLRNGTCPSHCNLSLLQSWHWGGPLVTLHTFFLCSALPLSRFPPSLHPLVIWRPDGAVAGEGSFSCAPYFLLKNLLQGKEEWVGGGCGGLGGNINEKLYAVSRRVSS